MAVTSEFKGLTLDELIAPDILYRDQQEKSIAQGIEELDKVAKYKSMLDPHVDAEEIAQIDQYNNILSDAVNRIAKGLTAEDLGILNQGRLFYGSNIQPSAEKALLRAEKIKEQQDAYNKSNGMLRFDKDFSRINLREFNPHDTYKSVNLDDVYKKSEAVFKSLGESLAQYGLEDVVLNNGIRLQQAFTMGVPLEVIQQQLANSGDEYGSMAHYLVSQAIDDIKSTYNAQDFDEGVNGAIDATIDSAIYNANTKKYQGQVIDPEQQRLEREQLRASIEAQRALANERNRGNKNKKNKNGDYKNGNATTMYNAYKSFFASFKDTNGKIVSSITVNGNTYDKVFNFAGECIVLDDETDTFKIVSNNGTGSELKDFKFDKEYTIPNGGSKFTIKTIAFNKSTDDTLSFANSNGLLRFNRPNSNVFYIDNKNKGNIKLEDILYTQVKNNSITKEKLEELIKDIRFETSVENDDSNGIDELLKKSLDTYKGKIGIQCKINGGDITIKIGDLSNETLIYNSSIKYDKEGNQKVTFKEYLDTINKSLELEQVEEYSNNNTRSNEEPREEVEEYIEEETEGNKTQGQSDNNPNSGTPQQDSTGASEQKATEIPQQNQGSTNKSHTDNSTNKEESTESTESTEQSDSIDVSKDEVRKEIRRRANRVYDKLTSASSYSSDSFEDSGISELYIGNIEKFKNPGESTSNSELEWLKAAIVNVYLDLEELRRCEVYELDNEIGYGATNIDFSKKIIDYCELAKADILKRLDMTEDALLNEAIE